MLKRFDSDLDNSQPISNFWNLVYMIFVLMSIFWTISPLLEGSKDKKRLHDWHDYEPLEVAHYTYILDTFEQCIEHHLLILKFTGKSNEMFVWIILFHYQITSFRLTIVKAFHSNFFCWLEWEIQRNENVWAKFSLKERKSSLHFKISFQKRVQVFLMSALYFKTISFANIFKRARPYCALLDPINK
nr:PREDICTED: uncharacterized protein LOC103314063 isoform X6 [Tribolium castaneum]XP_015838108.1 PREDICTED: uncharacterized protein LOC103314063 isoform X6 [Tribolium castaneum]|eukprot:XP_015838107.1 PREDICTED: uncharacterized protein LOC103314063 isoform X6 [Tribolium castaneum]